MNNLSSGIGRVPRYKDYLQVESRGNELGASERVAGQSQCLGGGGRDKISTSSCALGTRNFLVERDPQLCWPVLLFIIRNTRSLSPRTIAFVVCLHTVSSICALAAAGSAQSKQPRRVVVTGSASGCSQEHSCAPVLYGEPASVSSASCYKATRHRARACVPVACGSGECCWLWVACSEHRPQERPLQRVSRVERKLLRRRKVFPPRQTY